ncbi:MAG: maleylpyruvate isomerase family mycothiol-dependent enzyme [bacterium]|nr:maleylpyruvate isomerase family mycothiol-dependent enzyme [bacterium]
MLSVADYLAHLDADAHLLAAAAVRGPDAMVPGCPAWTVSDLLSHVAAVHARSSDIVEQGLVDRWPERARPPAGVDPLDWYRSGADRLCRVLAAADPTAPAQGFGGVTTIEFWIRRMAHETAVHRIDAEQAHGYESLFDAELASDGIDELFDVFATRIPSSAEFLPSEDLVRIDAGGRPRILRFGRAVGESRGKRFDILKAVLDPDATADTAVAGEPDRVLLWMWGRASLEGISASGDPQIVDRLREVCSI